MQSVFNLFNCQTPAYLSRYERKSGSSDEYEDIYEKSRKRVGDSHLKYEVKNKFVSKNK